MSSRIEKKGLKILQDAGIASKEDLKRIFEEAEKAGTPFSSLLIKSGLLKEPQILEAYAKATDRPFLNLKTVKWDNKILDKVPVKLASYYKFFPVKLEGKKLTIAVSRLLDVHILDEIRFGLDLEVDSVFALERDVEDMLKKYYGLAADTVERILTQSPGRGGGGLKHESNVPIENIEQSPEHASVVQLVNQIILDAYKKNASDIHLEPYRGKVRLRYRIDGSLHEANVPPEMRKFFMSILSRIKIMANLNIVERRMPQDGKARVRTEDQALDLRISSIPTPHGESLVIRILPSKMIHKIEDLGFDLNELIMFQELLKKPHGIIFATGPTGSGKSTTLYAALGTLNREHSKVITIEDPVEYELEGTTQIQVQQDIGLTFSRGLRSVLRHDPDIMMVGEVRDLETADIAIRVALTGHLILSTLHTNDAASGVTRLLDIGVEPYLVASSVNAFIGQRLVRVICPSCKEENREVLDEVKEMMASELGLPRDEAISISHGAGCDECTGTGYMGRTAVYEILPVSEEIRKLVFSHASSSEIKRAARIAGMTTLRQNGWKKVLMGLTTPDEIMRVAPPDEKISGTVSRRSASGGHNMVLTGPEPVSKAGKGKKDDAGPARNLSSAKKEPTEDSTVNERSQPEKQEPLPEDDALIGDRRSYQRLNIKRKIAFIAADDLDKKKEQNYKEGAIEDISASGISFHSAQSVNSGQHLNVRFRLTEHGDLLECLGRVIRVRRAVGEGPDKGKYVFLIGLTFVAIDRKSRQIIEEFVNKKGAV